MPFRGPRIAKKYLLMFLAGTLATLSACLRGPALLKQSGSLGTSQATLMASTEEDGAVTGTFDPASGSQILIASDGSGIAGTSVLFPSGALSFPAAFTLEPGASIATPSIASTIGLNGFSGSGSAVVLSSSTSINTDTPMTLSIPLPSVSALQMVMSLFEDVYTSMVVVYRVKDAETGKFETGIIPRAEIQIVDGKAQFSSRRLGAFQTAIVTPEEAVAAKKVEHTEAVNIFTARDVKKIPPFELSGVTPGSSSRIRGEGLLTVTGTYFKSDLLAAQVAVEGRSFDAKPVRVSNDGTTASFNMPAGVPHDKPVTIVLKQGEVSREIAGPRHDTSGPVISASTVTSGPSPDTDGKYYVNNASIHTYTVTTPLADIAPSTTAAASMFAFTGPSTAVISNPNINNTGLTFTIGSFSGDGVLTVKLKSGALTDDVGNPSPETTLVSFVVDNTAPTATLSGTPSNPSKITHLNITVGGEGVKTYKYKVGLESTLSACSDAADYSDERSFAATIGNQIQSQDGSHRLCVLATDNAGNIQSTATSYDWTKDTTAPAPPLIDKINGSSGNPVETNNDKPVFEGTKPAGNPVKISVYRMTDPRTLVGSVNVNNSDTTWSFTPAAAIPLGFHSVFATATDAAGNESYDGSAKPLTIDQTAPSAPTVDTIDGQSTTSPVLTNNKRPVIAGTFIATEVDAKKIQVFRRGTGSEDTDSLIAEIDKPASGSNWSLTPPTDIPHGEHSITAKVVDKAGNEGPASPTKNLTIDTVPPIATISGAPSGATTASDITIQVGGAGVVSYRYKLGLNPPSDYCRSGEDSEYQPSSPSPINTPINSALINDGEYRLCVIGIDAAGNQQSRDSATQSSWVKGSATFAVTRPSQKSMLVFPGASTPFVLASYLQTTENTSKIKFNYGNAGTSPGYSTSADLPASADTEWSIANHPTEVHLAMTKNTQEWRYALGEFTSSDPSSLQFDTSASPIETASSGQVYTLPTIAVSNSGKVFCSAAVLRSEPNGQASDDSLQLFCALAATDTRLQPESDILRTVMRLPRTGDNIFADVRIVASSQGENFFIHAATKNGELFSWNYAWKRGLLPIGQQPNQAPEVRSYPNNCEVKTLATLNGKIYAGGKISNENNGCLYKSADGGRTWESLPLSFGGGPIRSMITVGDKLLVAGEFLVSANGASPSRLLILSDLENPTPDVAFTGYAPTVGIKSLTSDGGTVLALDGSGLMKEARLDTGALTWSTRGPGSADSVTPSFQKVSITANGTVLAFARTQNSPEAQKIYRLNTSGSAETWEVQLTSPTGTSFESFSVHGNHVYLIKKSVVNQLEYYSVVRHHVTNGAVSSTGTQVYSDTIAILPGMLETTELGFFASAPSTSQCYVLAETARVRDGLISGDPNEPNDKSTNGFSLNQSTDRTFTHMVYNTPKKFTVFAKFPEATLKWSAPATVANSASLAGLPAIFETDDPTSGKKIFGLWIERISGSGVAEIHNVKYLNWSATDAPSTGSMAQLFPANGGSSQTLSGLPAIAAEPFLRMMGVTSSGPVFVP